MGLDRHCRRSCHARHPFAAIAAQAGAFSFSALSTSHLGVAKAEPVGASAPLDPRAQNGLVSGGHDESYWNDHWDEYLRFYAEAFRDCGADE